MARFLPSVGRTVGDLEALSGLEVAVLGTDEKIKGERGWGTAQL